MTGKKRELMLRIVLTLIAFLAASVPLTGCCLCKSEVARLEQRADLNAHSINELRCEMKKAPPGRKWIYTSMTPGGRPRCIQVGKVPGRALYSIPSDPAARERLKRRLESVKCPSGRCSFPRARPRPRPRKCTSGGCRISLP